LGGLIQEKPKDPVQFLIDSLSFGDAKLAVQDKNGLSGYRRARLLEVFRQMDNDRSGYVDFKEIQAHSSKYGGQALTEAELREVFRDFDVSGDNQVSEEEFLVFFGRSVSHVSNEDFDQMVSEMLG